MALVAEPVMAFLVLPVRQTRSTYIKVIWPLVVTVLEFMLWPQAVRVEMAVTIRMQIVAEPTLQTAFLVVLVPLLMLRGELVLLGLQASLLPEFMQCLAEVMAEMVAEIIRVVMRAPGVMAQLAVQCLY
jgi:hypothetical protein